MRNLFALLTLAGLITLTGCSADDLTGPETLASEAPASARSEEALDATLGSQIDGMWQADDRHGAVALSLTTTGSSGNAIQLAGRGTLQSNQALTLPVVLAGGMYRSSGLAFTLTNDAGRVLAKAEGWVARDFSAFRVVLQHTDGQRRELVFTRAPRVGTNG